MPKQSSKLGEDSLDAQIQKIASARANPVACMIVAITVALLPAYLSQAVMRLDWLSHLWLYLPIPIVAAFGIAEAYRIFFHCEFVLKYNPNDAKYKKALASTATERDGLRYQSALGYSLFFSNVFFLLSVLFLHFYLFQAFDARLSFAGSEIAASAVLYVLAQQNEKSILKKLHIQK
eukprot:NODE_8305_length_691_cov_34.980634_g7683_i0.p2 GENE.NODE_8305_length_691_cov_34.980634_g7683_i0~~NODE_8305_length_691_cov_34.980634_g7683_i0.p2  ORF type:complete len:177 (+),score=14.87 NODE_8305_length_691_cov_34.980634_g7683_i0:54-584(+)